MALHTTQWRPDTCGCVLSYSWDDEVPAEQRTHTPGPAQPCAAHARNPAGAFEAAMGENRLKNKVLGHVGATDPALLEKVAWAFDADRKLSLDLKALPVTDRARVRALVAALPEAAGRVLT